MINVVENPFLFSLIFAAQKPIFLLFSMKIIKNWLFLGASTGTGAPRNTHKIISSSLLAYFWLMAIFYQFLNHCNGWYLHICHVATGATTWCNASDLPLCLSALVHTPNKLRKFIVFVEPYWVNCFNTISWIYLALMIFWGAVFQ